jgi:membrane-associated phospholipid phosphatase
LTGKKEAAERFLIANTIAFLFAVPLFSLLPAIGPWAGYHFVGTAEQKACEASIIALHNRHFTDQLRVVGIVCFPSFHVIWAILSAVALSSLKYLRIVANAFAILVVASTVSTGWHYVADVLGGLIFVAISLVCADIVMRHAHC